MIVILGAIYWTKAGDELSITEAFTSLSIISLTSQPLVLMITSLAQVGGVLGSFMRMQTFLLLEEQKDHRTAIEKSNGGESLKSSAGVQGPPDSGVGRGLDKSSLPEGIDVSQAAVQFNSASFNAEDGTELLRGIDMAVPQGTITMIVSRVGGGKSSLLKAIIGEFTPDHGTVMVATGSSAYCDQVPWLRNATIRENILGQTPVDEDWLWAVTHACALDQDISSLPRGDATMVGSGGVALSGGQKQRIVSRGFLSSN